MADTMTITETAPDGTTTTIEITEATDDSTLIEDVIEALTGDETDAEIQDAEIADGEYEVVAEEESAAETAVETETPEWTTEAVFDQMAAENNEIMGEIMNKDYVNESAAAYNDALADAGVFGAADVTAPASAEWTEGSFGLPGENYIDPQSDVYIAPDVSAFETTASDLTAEATTENDAANAAALETQAHADAAREAQEAASEFVAKGDYAAAAEAREVAENEAWEAGDNYILEGSTSAQLETAAQEQETAEYYQAQQDEYARAGDYEAAAEAAENVVQATGNADWYASGSDHTAQARAEEYQMDYAVWEENNAEYYANAADQFAADGNLEAAADYADSAVEHQAAADYHADLGTGGVYDSTSIVETGGSYEAADYSSSYDYSATDTATE